MKIYVAEGQSAVSLINQVAGLDEHDIELVFPEKSSFFDEPENLELLKRQGELAGKVVSVTSANASYVEMAKQFGIESKPKERKSSSGKAPADAKALLGESEGKQKSRRKVRDMKPADSIDTEASEDSLEDTQPSSIEEPFFEEIERELTQDTDGSEASEFTKRYFDLGQKKPTIQENEIIAAEEHTEPPMQPHTQEPPPLTQEMFKEGHPLVDEVFEEPQEGQKEPKPPMHEQFKQGAKRGRLMVWYKVGIGLVGLGVLAFLYIYLPSASVEVFAQRHRVDVSLDVKANKKSNAAAVVGELPTIPVQTLQITKELSEPFTLGTKGSFSKKTKGIITVFNEYSSPQFMIPSRFESNKGNIYWSQRNIRIPTRGSLEIEVVADKEGEAYNLSCSEVAPCSFTVPAWKGTENFTKVYAKGTSAFTGGVSGEGYIVSKDEFTEAEGILRGKLLQEAQKELAVQVPEQFVLLEDTIQSDVVELVSSPALNSLATTNEAVITGKMRLKAFLIREKDLEALVDILVRSQIEDDKESKPDTVSVEYTVDSVNFEEGIVALSVSASEEAASRIDSDALRRELIGKSEQEVRDLLSVMPTVQSVQVTLWPFWVREIPERLERITIDIK